MSGTQIPLQFRPTPNIGPDFGQAVGDATRVLQLREAQQQAQKGNALQNIMAQPGALDAMGQPTPETMKAVMGVDVNAGLKLRQAQMVNEEQVLRTDMLKSDSFAKKMEIVGSNYGPIVEGYEEAVKGGAPQGQAAAEAQRALNDANERLKNGGLFTPDEQKKMPTQFDPIQLRSAVAGTKHYETWRKDQQTSRRLDDAEKRESDTGWQVVLDTANLDANGRPTEVEYNPRTNKTRTLGEGKPYQPATPMRISATGQAKEFGKPALFKWTGPDGKEVRQTLEEDKNGGWVDAVTRTPVSPGKDMTEVHAGEQNAAAGGLDDKTLDRMVIQGAKGQPVTSMMNTRNKVDIDKYNNRLTKYLEDQGKTPEESATIIERANARWHSMTRTYDQFTSAQQGSPGGQVVAANTAIQHINVAREAAKALGNGDINLANRLWQRIAEETGDPAPTNMQAISQFVANEVSRASAGAALTGEERGAMAADLANYRSPAQLYGAMDKFQQLLAGKLNSLRYTYRFGTGIKDPDDPYSFETLVGSPDTLKVLGWDKKGEGAAAPAATDGAVTGTGGPWKGHAIPDKAIADLRKAPDTAAVFDEHFQSPGLAASILGTKATPGAGASPTQKDALPAPGVLPGQLHLDPTIAPTVPKGAPRPFAPGEYIRNPNGGWSSEISVTVDDPRMNGGKPTVLPSLWVVDGKPYRAKDEDEAVDFALRSKLPFRSFANMDAAEKFATDREAAWQKVDQSKPETARSIPSLWASGQRTNTPDQPQGTRPAAPPSAPTTEGATPQSWAVPAKHASDPDGTTYNGGKYVKRGDTVVAAQQAAPADEQVSLDRARAAIKQGAKRADVEKMLRDAGIDPGKL